jgi:hypothetical protein
VFNQIPSRQFFRDIYDDLTIKFDYHVKMLIEDEEENNDFKVNIIMEMEEKPLLNMEIIVKFTGYEMSDKLSAKYKFGLSDDFNFRVSEKNIQILTNDN